jgi:hypothetical protein
MIEDEPHRKQIPPAVLWTLVATVALIAELRLGRAFAWRSGGEAPWRDPSWLALLLGSLATLAVAALATWRLVRLGSYAGLLTLGAVGLLLVEPGRAGEAATWRLEWGAFGVLWTAAAVAVFLWLLARQDERERRIHSEGAAVGLAIAVGAATAYALFEQALPPLDAQRVTIFLLAAWLCGRLITARRYR